MGISMGERDNFLQDLTSMGWISFLFFLIPAVISTIFVYFLSRWFLERKGGKR